MNNKHNLLPIRIKELRKAKGLTQKQLAIATNISYSSIIDYENGRREPNSKAMVALESFFQVTGEYLRGNTNDIDPLFKWEDSEIMDAVQESLPPLLEKLMNTFKNSSSLEQKMLFDILVELCHVAGTGKDNPSFRSAAFLLIQENFVQTTRFIDFCKHLPMSSDLETTRLENFKTSCITDFDKALTEFHDSIKE